MGENGVSCAAKSAQDLLDEFQKTGSQQPFEEIARRYAGMVYNVALRVTRDGHDAEDAAQATFLTLAVHAKTAGKIRYLGPWLKKVSHRLALDIRRSKKRRTAREQRHADENGDGLEPPASTGLQSEELRHILREEIDKLPAKYRMPLILYYFGGLSPEEMSKELQCNTSTLGVRLHRGRKMLADSLTGRGISMNAAVVAAALSGVVDNFVRDNLIHACAHTAAHVASTGRIALDAHASANVITLMRAATAALRWSKLKIAVSVALALFGGIAGASEVLHRYDVISTGFLRYLNPLRMIRPLMDRMQVIPRLSVNAPAQTGPIFQNEPTAVDIPSYASYLSSPLEFGGELGGMQFPDFAPIRSASDTGKPAASLRSVPQTPPALAGAGAASFSFPSVASGLTAPPVKSPTVNLASGNASTSARSGGSNIIAGGPTGFIVDRAIANPAALGGKFIFDGNLLQASRLVVGDASDGNFVLQSGTVQAEQVVVGNQKRSHGTMRIEQGGSLRASEIVVGNAGIGNITQLGGSVVASGQTPGTLTLGAEPSGAGTYVQQDGDLFADTLTVGAKGTGTFNLVGGTAAISVGQTGSAETGHGTINVTGGSLVTVTPSTPAIVYAILTGTSVSPVPPPAPVLAVGGAGAGTLVLQQDSAQSIITETPGTQGSNLIVRSSESGKGTVIGYGKVDLTGQVIMNSRIIADGKGTSQTLDLSSASRVTSTIDNPAQNGTNGFYARNGGKLKLPSIKVTGDYSYTWGEENFDASIDLVNSVRFRPDIGSEAGYVDIALLDPTARNIPALPGGRSAIGLWELDSTVDLTSLNLMIRYDDALAGSMHLSENDLALWVYEANQWQIVADYAGIDTTNHLIWGRADGQPSYFAAAPIHGGKAPNVGLVPEPSIISVGLIGAASMLLRRRRSSTPRRTQL